MPAELSGIAWLQSLPMWDGSSFSPLDVPKRLLEVLGNPQDCVCSVHVTGTNGKGSVAAFVAAMLRSSGANVGQFSSPHLTSVAERCVINGEPIGLSYFDRALLQVRHVSDVEGFSPTYFVATACASFLCFAQAKLDWMVVEVGLGGTYDATNLLANPSACVITSVGLDHTHVLGTTVAEIAANKAGIIKCHSNVFVGAVDSEAASVIRDVVKKHEARAEFFGDDFWLTEQSVSRAEGVICEIPATNPIFACPYQRKNAALAARVGEALGLSSTELIDGLSRVRWPGRVEEIVLRASDFKPELGSKKAKVLIDGAHNPQGATALIDYLELLSRERRELTRFVFLLAMLQRKDWRKMVRLYLEFTEKLKSRGISSRFVFTASGHKDSLEPQEFLAVAPEGAKAISGVKEALGEALKEADEKTLVVAAGSLFFVGELRPLITQRPFRTLA